MNELYSRSNYSYIEMKRGSAGYQKAKERLIGEGPFAGWVFTGSELQNFMLDDQISQSGNDTGPWLYY